MGNIVLERLGFTRAATSADELGKLVSLPVRDGASAGGNGAPDATAPTAPSRPVTTPPETATAQGDRSLPDPTRRARMLGAVIILAAVAIGILLNVAGWTARPFDPARIQAANFALFAGFYVAALIVERASEFIAPSVPWWDPPQGVGGKAIDEAGRTAHTKADRGTIMLALTFLMSVVLAGSLGLFFMAAIGMNVSHTVDTLLTAIVIAGGTKKLHDFISLLQNRDNPKTTVGTT